MQDVRPWCGWPEQCTPADVRKWAVVSSLLLACALVPVAKGSAGAQVEGSSDQPDMSANGRFVVFQSTKQLVPGVTNIGFNVYLRDTVTGRTSLISRTATGQAGNDTSWEPSISADGRFVAFDSWASNLVAGDTNRQRDVFVFDRRTGSMRRISAKGTVQGNGASWYPDVAGNGSKVAFETEATNLISRDSNRQHDIAVWTRSTGAITQANVTSAGKQANGSSWWRPSINNDGTRIAFFSDATNLGTPTGSQTIQVRDTSAGKTYRVATCTHDPDPSVFCMFDAELSLSGNGRRLAFSMRSQASTSFDEDWRVIAVPSGRVSHSGRGVDTELAGLVVNRDGTAYAVAMDGLHVHNALGSWDQLGLGGWTAMSADGVQVAARGPNDGIYLWDTATGNVTQVDVP